MRLRYILFREKPVEVLLHLFEPNGGKFMLDISRRTGITFSHVDKLIKKYVEAGLVNREIKDRVVLLNLTTYGINIVKELKTVYDKIGKIEEEVYKKMGGKL